MTLLDKFSSTVRIELSTQLAYKLNFVLLVIGPPLVFFFVKANLWWSIFHVREGAPVGSYSLSDMLTYQAYVLIVTLLCQSYANRNISEDIRFGRISAFLLYPISFIGYHLGAFTSAQLLNIATAALVLAGVYFVGIAPHFTLYNFCMGFAFTLWVSLLWFGIWFCLSVTAFWLDESWVLRVMFILVARFLSGAWIPLELFPKTLADILWYTPFPYLTFVPVQMFMGNAPVDLLPAIGVTLFWIALIYLLALALWRRGLGLYSAAGI